MSLSGTFSTMPFPDLMQWLGDARRSGTHLLSRIDGKRDVGALTVMTPVGELETLRVLRRFQRLGLVAFRTG